MNVPRQHMSMPSAPTSKARDPGLPGMMRILLLAFGLVALGACGGETSPAKTPATAVEGVGTSPAVTPAATVEDVEPSSAEAPAAAVEGSEPSSVSAGSQYTVRTADHPDLGTIVVDGEGFTLYTFKGDDLNSSSCAGECAVTWPPLPAPPDGPRVSIALISIAYVGTITREDGTSQVVYEGKPLYYYYNDKNPGDVRGQGIDGQWSVVSGGLVGLIPAK